MCVCIYYILSCELKYRIYLQYIQYYSNIIMCLSTGYIYIYSYNTVKFVYILHLRKTC